jgi:hypothetical protein
MKSCSNDKRHLPAHGRLKTLLEEYGWEPYLMDATKSLKFEIPEDLDHSWRKGLMMENPNMCSAAKACRDRSDVIDAIIVAKYAYLQMINGDQVRYEHKGIVPRMQDNYLMPPPGIYHLSAVCRSHAFGKGKPRGAADGSSPKPKGPNGPIKSHRIPRNTQRWV